MGGSGGKKTKKPSVQHAPMLDMNAIMQSGSDAAVKQIGEQYKQLIANYPALENLQFGTVDRIRGLIDNEAGRTAQDAVNRGLALSRAEDADPTSIERRLYDDTERDLALGRSLSAEEARDATQSARGAFAARGLGTGSGAAAAEILNRDSFARAREADRRQQAVTANNLLMGNVMARREMMANNLYAGAGNLMNVDPTNRALGIGLQSSQNQQGNMMNQIGSTFAGANQMAGNIASFNSNMIESRANSAMNNWAAMNAARMNASAMNQSGTMGMIGGIGGGALAGAGSVGMGMALAGASF
jgi:hypothetical protein